MFIKTIGIAGAGTMGIGIALAGAIAGTNVILYDNYPNSINNAKSIIETNLNKLLEKNKINSTEKIDILNRINFTEDINDFKDCDLFIEAIIEDFDAKKVLFQSISNIVNDNCIISTNTSSLSVSSLASTVKNKSNFLGIHFFNPANILKLVEVIPTSSTSKEIVQIVVDLLKDKWKKLPVIAKDTPGFIVNRVARPYYSEALRIYEEGIANFETIDYAMKNIGGFKMGPFELMDFIGNDINYKVTEKVWEQLYFDTRFTPSITQKRLVESGNLGRKTGKGFYEYNSTNANNNLDSDTELHQQIFERILSMLINIAADAYYLKIASREDIDIAVTSGVNYPKGLLKWADEIGIEKVYSNLKDLYEFYNEDRYRPSPIIIKLFKENKLFYNIIN